MSKETGKLIEDLGNSFRGLWVNVILAFDGDDMVRNKDWCVTYIFQGEYFETPGFDKPESALKFAKLMVNHCKEKLE